MHKEKHDTLIVLAGGMSSRMKKALRKGADISPEELAQANSRTKGLLEIGQAGRPVLDYLLWTAQRSGYGTIYLVVNAKGLPLFQSYYGKSISGNNFHGLKIHFVVQKIPKDRAKPLGTADAIYQSLESYPELKTQYFTVCNSDNLYDNTAFSTLRFKRQALVAYDREGLQFPMEKIQRFAVLDISEEGYLKGIVEKPSTEQVASFRQEDGAMYVSMNIFCMNGAQMYTHLRDCPLDPIRKEKEIPRAILSLLQEDAKGFFCYKTKRHVPDLTAKEDIKLIKNYLKNNFPLHLWG